MKKTLSILLCGALLALFTGCSSTTVSPSTSPSSTAEATDEPTAEPTSEPSAEPSSEPSEEPNAEIPPEGAVEHDGSCGYSLTYDAAQYSVSTEDGVDRYTLTADAAQTTQLVIRALAAEEVDAYEQESLGDDIQQVTLGISSYAASAKETTETNANGNSITRAVYTIAREDGGKLAIEVTCADESYQSDLKDLLATLTLK